MSQTDRVRKGFLGIVTTGLTVEGVTGNRDGEQENSLGHRNSMCKGFVAGRSLYRRRLQRPKILSTDVKNEHGGKIGFEKSLESVQVRLHRPL